MLLIHKETAEIYEVLACGVNIYITTNSNDRDDNYVVIEYKNENFEYLGSL